MKRPQQRTGPTLPADLLERINATEDANSSKRKHKASRKDARKQEREEKKHRKAAYFTESKSRVTPSASASTSSSQNPASTSALSKKRPAPNSSGTDPALKKRRVSLDGSPKVIVKPVKQTSPAPTPKAVATLPLKPAAGPVKKKKKTELSITDIMPSSKTAPEATEEKEIARLEALLGVSKKSSKSRYGAEFEEDGLDDLLMDVDRILAITHAPAAANDESIASFDEDEALQQSDIEDVSSSAESDAISGVAESEDDSSSEEVTLPPSIAETITPPSEGASGGRYIPPHLRASKSEATPTVENIKLRRQIKGLLNRMSEQNIENLLAEFLALYRTHPRNEVTTTIASQIIDGITSHSSLLDAYVILHATLVASLHKLVGIDFAAQFVETCVTLYESYRRAASSAPTSTTVEASDDTVVDVPQGKECMNMMVLISELYNFQVISCVLAYDVIRDLLADSITELNVELLLKITRNSGSQLRQDDPLALRDIVQLVQAKVGDKNPRELGSRIRFMLETLNNLKNNKVKPSAAQAQGTDSVTRLRKFLNGLSKKHHVLAHEPLNVSLADLRSADKKGKWWLVGSAWAGDPLLEAKGAEKAVASKTLPPSSTEEALFKLARKQGMNTEVRRSIFVVLMSSDDYVDACERLGHLSLNEVQRREIGRVLVHCCGNEKAYNPYYTMVGQQLCRGSHAFQITLQYCLWDFLREIGENEVGGTAMIANLDSGLDALDKKATSASKHKIQNVAHAYAWWAAKGCISLAVLKAVPLDALEEQGQDFFRAFFAQLFIGSQSGSPLHSYRTLPAKGALPFGKDARLLEPLLLKVVAQHTTMATGMYRFLTKAKWEELAATGNVLDFLNWASDSVKETIREGLDL